MKKKLIGILGFLILTAVVLLFVTDILRPKSEHGINQARGLYYQPRETVDVLFLGSSHVHCDVDTGMLWEQYGIAAYLCSSADQPLWNSYHYLIEALKYQKPKLVVLDMYCPVRYRDDYQEVWASQNLAGMRISWNKYLAARASVEKDRIGYLLGFPHYHDRYDSLEEEDFDHFIWDRKELSGFKGYTPLQRCEPQEEPDCSTAQECRPLTAKSNDYLNRIIAHCREEKIQLVLVAAPFLWNEEDQQGFLEVSRIAGENGLLFLNYNTPGMVDAIGMDFETDMADESHLNESGSEKYTAHLGKWLKENFEIPDRRGDPAYKSWEIGADEACGPAEE